MKGLNWVTKLEKLLFFMKNDWKFIFSIFHTSAKFSWVTRIQKYFFAIWHYQQRILSKIIVLKGLIWVKKLEKLLFFMKNDWKFIFSIFHISVKFFWVTRIQKCFFAIWHYQQKVLSRKNHILRELKHFLSKIRWETYRSDFGHFAWFAQNTAQMRYRVKILHILTNFRI